MSRTIVRPLVCFAALLASTVTAADLPPQEAPPYTGVYKMSQRGRDDDGREWKYTTEDTITIAVLHKQLRVERKTQGTTQIIDSVGGYTTAFGGKTPAGRAVRTKMSVVPIGWEFGYARAMKATGKEPEVLGQATIAGQPCTRLKFVSEQYGEPEYCVAKNGIVLKFANTSSTAEATYEAISIDEKAPDASRFVTPADLKIEQRGARKPVKLNF